MKHTHEKLVSVLMPNYNGAAFIEEALMSVLRQTYTNLEVIVVDDHSTDNSWELLQEIMAQDTRVRALRNDKNRGIPHTRNRLLREVSNKACYIALLDSDDRMAPDRIAKQVAYLEGNRRVGVVGSWLRFIDREGQAFGTREYPTGASEIQRSLLSVNPVAQPAVMLRRSIVRKVGEYSTYLYMAEDIDYWARIIRKGATIENIPEALTCYRVHKKGGLLGRSRRHLWFGFLARLKHVYSPHLVTPRALFATGAYLVAVVSPRPLIEFVARHFFRDYDTVNA